MKYLRVLLLCAMTAWIPAALAQETKAPEQAHQQEGAEPAKHEEGESNVETWKIANFVIMALAIGYLIGKNAPPFFKSRSQHIRKDMVEADEARQAAETRVAEVDRRLANLEAEIQALRTESQKEGESETQRITQHTAAEIAKIQAHAEQEIVAAGKAARLELKRYSAELAVALAEKKIQSRMTPATQDALVQGFVRDLK